MDKKFLPTDLTKVKGTQARLYYKNAIDIMKSLKKNKMSVPYVS